MDFDYDVDEILNSVKDDSKKSVSENLSPSDELLDRLRSFNLNNDSNEEKDEAKPLAEPDHKAVIKEEKGASPPFNPPNPSANENVKKIIAAVCVALALVAVVFGGIKIAQHAKTAYIRSYEKQYNVNYPDGILKEFCDEYGKDQSLAGNLTIEDTSTDVRVYSVEKAGTARLDKGSDVKEEQHIRAISLDKELADLESVYATPEGFLKASQKITFKTLFGEEEYRVVAAYYTNTDPKDDNGYVFPYSTYGNLTAKSFHNFQDKVKNRSLYDTNYDLLAENYILSVSVPSDFMSNFRFVVVCVKTDKKFEKSQTATPNDRIHYPQIWYDKNKKDNPFYLAGKWYPEIVLQNGKTKRLTLKDFQN